jgi:hypothetical protein
VRRRPCDPTAISVARLVSAWFSMTATGSPSRSFAVAEGAIACASARAASASCCMSSAAWRAAIPACAACATFAIAKRRTLACSPCRRSACRTATRLAGVPSTPQTMRSKTPVSLARAPIAGSTEPIPSRSRPVSYLLPSPDFARVSRMQLDRALETETERPLDRNVVVGEPGWPGHAEDLAPAKRTRRERMILRQRVGDVTVHAEVRRRATPERCYAVSCAGPATRPVQQPGCRREAVEATFLLARAWPPPGE